MITGLDWGGSFADAILWDKTIKATFSLPSRQTTAEELLNGLLKQENEKPTNIQTVAITGGDAKRISEKLLGINVSIQDEIQSICRGALTLSEINEAVAVSCGTGTAIAYYLNEDEVHTMHLGGTAVGGGTIEGLGKLLLQKTIPEILALAENGNPLDLTVHDIVGGSIGVIPAEATAAHFAKAQANSTHQDIAKSLIHMVAETIGTMACVASDKTGCQDLVFTGRVAQNKLVQDRILFACRIHNKKAHFPKNGEYATAIGAAINAETKK